MIGNRIDTNDTIAAIASGMGGAIGIVRLSGSRAIEIADSVFKGANGQTLSSFPTHTIHYGKIIDGDKTIDEVLMLLMKAPATYTREDVVEIDCHGGAYVTRCVLETLIKAGARPAEAGEFTKRAFLNGRIDLGQAEAVVDIINSKNKHALAGALNVLDGKLSMILKKIRAEILEKVAYIESALDDPEHFSLDNYVDNLEKDVDKWKNSVDKLVKTGKSGKLFTEGVKTVILGRPNAGKSSILNYMSGHERAIVTEIAGTTRDILEEQIIVGGIMLNLIDTAGIHDTEDVIETIGVERAKAAIDEADLILYVVDSSAPLTDDDRLIAELIENKKYIVLLNKSDLTSLTNEGDIRSLLASDGATIISMSAKDMTGLEELSDAIVAMFTDGTIEYNDEMYIADERKMYALRQAEESLDLVLEGCHNKMSEEFLTIDLMSAYASLGSILGEEVSEDLLNEIFSKFCMGK